jgi:hypothetical protein
MCPPEFTEISKVRITYVHSDHVAPRPLCFVDYRDEQPDRWADVLISDAEPSDDFKFSREIEEEPTVWHGSSNLRSCKSTRWVIEGNESECHDSPSYRNANHKTSNIVWRLQLKLGIQNS